MRLLEDLLKNNRKWVDDMKAVDPDFFNKLAGQNKPEFLWIGCSDSRVHATEITGLMPGELFVHRNIANLVIHTDMNALSVIQYAVEVLEIKHIIVCGHYGCGGIKAAMENKEHGLIDNWLRHIRDIYRIYEKRFDEIEDEKERYELLCELNVIEQVANVCHTTIIQNAWKSGRELAIHGLIYSIEDGILKDLDVRVTSQDQLPDSHRIG